MTPRVSATLTIVGDLHRIWRPSDGDWLERARPDLAMFVGDLGDEDPAIVRTVASVRVPKVVILGNHDAWQSFKSKRSTPQLRESLGILGQDHLGYSIREVPSAGITVIGARPFSWGGQDLRSPELYEELYGVHTTKQSTARIVELARKAQHRDIVILAHNGPLGLSREAGDIYGKDFGKPGGDWGDRDLALAIARIGAEGQRVRMVIAGHMHHELVYPRGALRRRFMRQNGTQYINPAVVPRVRESADGGTESYFVRTRWAEGQCLSVEELWLDNSGIERVTVPTFQEALPLPAGGIAEEGGE
ncbi:MAG: TIGR04168 family protein [Planctomycetota bacterium]